MPDIEVDSVDALFGELRSVVAEVPTPEGWERLCRLVTRSHALSPDHHAEAVEPYLLAALRAWPDELRRAWLIEDSSELAALSRTLIVEGQDEGPAPDAVASYLLREVGHARCARLTRLELRTCVHDPEGVLGVLVDALPSITDVYANVYFDDDERSARRRSRAHTLDAIRLANAIVDAWGDGLEGFGFTSFGTLESGKSPADHAWSVILRRREELPNLRALRIDLDGDDEVRWDIELLGDPRFDAIEEVTIVEGIEAFDTRTLIEREASENLRRVKIVSPSAREAFPALVAAPTLSGVRAWELHTDIVVGAPVGWDTMLGRYWRAAAPACEDTFEDVFGTRWLNLLSLNARQTHDVLFNGKALRRSDAIEGIALREIGLSDFARFFKGLKGSVPSLRHLYIHPELVMRPKEVRELDASGVLDTLTTLTWHCSYGVSRRGLPWPAAVAASGNRAQWWELARDESLHPALRQRAWASANDGLKHKDSLVAFARAMGLERLSSLNMTRLREAIDAAAPDLLHEPMLMADPPPDVLIRAVDA